MKKRVLCSVCVLLITVQLFAQSTKITDCGVFSFSYPSSFMLSNVKKEPGFVMALESNKCFISASLTDLFIDGFSIWDDEIIGEFKNTNVQGVKIVKDDKIVVKTKSGNRKSYRIQCNIQRNGLKSFVIQYSFIHKEYLINVQFVYYNDDHTSCLMNAEELIRGIRFK